MFIDQKQSVKCSRFRDFKDSQKHGGRAVPVVKWLARWAFNPAVWVRFPDEQSVTITLSRHLYASPHVGHARRIRQVLKYRITDLEA